MENFSFCTVTQALIREIARCSTKRKYQIEKAK